MKTLGLDEEVASALQSFDGSETSAAVAVDRIVEASATTRFDLSKLIATALRHAWLMGRRSGGIFDGPDQVRNQNEDLKHLRDAYRPAFPHDPSEDTFMGSAEELRARRVEYVHLALAPGSEASLCGEPGGLVDDHRVASCPRCLEAIAAPGHGK